MGRVFSVLLSLVLAGCAHPYVWPPPYMLETTFPDEHYEQLILSAGDLAEPRLAAGDSLRMEVRHESCDVDVCSGDLEPLRDTHWTAGPSHRASIRQDGWLRATRSGTIWVRAEHGDTVLKRSIRVLPPIARIAWTNVPTVIRIGDTLSLRVAALDSAGHLVTYLSGPVSQLFRGNDPPASVEFATSLEPGWTRLAVVRPGKSRFVAHLAHRADTLVIEVKP